MRPRARGFSALETLVTTVLVLGVLLIASRVLIDAQSSMNELDNDDARLQLSLVQTRLRNDLRETVTLPPPSTRWRGDALVLQRRDGSETIWWERDHRLYRLDGSSGSAAPQSPVVLFEVEAWRWRPLTSGLLDVDVRLARDADDSDLEPRLVKRFDLPLRISP